ncbi:MAG: hypothetical protein Q8R00_01240 [Candidatus Nanoarchaeia archaeon]|nr:hypothetical protein [Candidatus Nanoarchaeia archaeon]
MKKYLTLRVWILIIFLIMSFIAISPRPWAKGIEITGVDESSPLTTYGLSTGEKILEINGDKIETLEDFNEAINKLHLEPKKITVETDKGEFSYEITDVIGFIVRGNETTLTVVEARDFTGLKKDMKILAINGDKLVGVKDYTAKLDELLKKEEFVMKTNKQEYALLLAGAPEIRVSEAATSNIQKGLELQGGSRALLKPISEEGVELTNKNIIDLIDVLQERLNVYGLADITIRSAEDLAGEKFVAVEIAGATREEVRELVAKQGVFEAKIGEEVVFRGGSGDLPFVCKGDGSCSGVRPPCSQIAPGQWSCQFQFQISLSPNAAAKHAAVTKDLTVNATAQGSYLSKQLDLFLDGELRDSLNIAADLKGRELTAILISGPGYGETEEAAYNDAIASMNQLQTILISGSLPLKLEIIKLDTISPVLGQEFVKNAILTGMLALLGVTLVIYIRYRRLLITVPVLITSLSELIMTLGFAALISWNLDIASIAGLIAAVGTGVDDQIVILDELIKGESKYINWKDRIKRAFGIIFGAYLTLAVAMIPLWNAGAGLLRGFAVTTLVGITVGVLITRPAFASICENIIKKK